MALAEVFHVDFAARKVKEVQVIELKKKSKGNYTGECTSDPIKEDEDIAKVCEYFREQGNTLMLAIFLFGINTAYRISDILSLRWEEVPELKTTRPEQKTGKHRLVYLNAVAKEAIDMMSAFGEEGYVFKSPRKTGEHATRQYVDKHLKEAVAACGIAAHAGTHLMRKTFAYHHIVKAPDRARALEHLMLLLGHSSVAVTLRYAGITNDEIRNAYLNVQLGTTAAGGQQASPSPLFTGEAPAPGAGDEPQGEERGPRLQAIASADAAAYARDGHGAAYPSNHLSLGTLSRPIAPAAFGLR